MPPQKNVIPQEERKRLETEFAEKWWSLPPTDNFIFGKMFSDETLCKKLLEHLLHITIKKLTLLPQNEKTLQTASYSHGIRLDVYAEDSDRAFDVEIQTVEKPSLPLRVRYYQSSLDTALLKRGDFYTSLKESYIIFLCTFDPFKLGFSTYEFQTVLKGHPDIIFDDKQRILLYNIAAYENERDTSIRDVLEFFATQRRNTEFGKEVGKRFDEVRNDETWRADYMMYSMAFQDAIYQGRIVGREEGIAIGERRGRKEDARNLKQLGVSEEIIAQATGLSREEVAAL